MILTKDGSVDIRMAVKDLHLGDVFESDSGYVFMKIIRSGKGRDSGFCRVVGMGLGITGEVTLVSDQEQVFLCDANLLVARKRTEPPL